MNTKDNRRRQESREKIENAFERLLRDKEPRMITVSDICFLAKVNRTTFYANYDNIPSLARSVQNRMRERLLEARRQALDSDGFAWLFQHIAEAQDFYSLYFKLCGFTGLDVQIAGIGSSPAEQYHAEFMIHGIHTIIDKWLRNGCVETAGEMNDVICGLCGKRTSTHCWQHKNDEEGLA